jgi:hypothetical protein
MRSGHLGTPVKKIGSCLMYIIIIYIIKDVQNLMPLEATLPDETGLPD